MEDQTAHDLEEELGVKVIKIVEQLYAAVQSAATIKDPITGFAIQSENRDAAGNILATFYLGKKSQSSAHSSKTTPGEESSAKNYKDFQKKDFKNKWELIHKSKNDDNLKNP